MMEDVKKDNRFAHVAKDSRFHRMPSQYRKVKIDNRFKSMFSDKRFKMKYQVDKRGRPVQTSTNENLKNYYELDSDDDDDDDDDDERDVAGPKVSEEISDQGDNASDHSEPRIKVDKLQERICNRNKVIDKRSDSEDEEDDNDEEDEERDDNYLKSTSDAIKQGIDVARGEGDISSSDDDDDEDSDDDNDSGVDEGVNVDHKWGELAADAPEAKEITSRLALCNMDWDRMKAQDILVLMNSFKPQGGVIESVKIYPSEYGLKRMDEDNRLGPVELRSTKSNPDDSSDEEDSEIHQEKLRQYQINRLKYYYAVITCDSSETADTIYEQCDGLEYETSSAKIDLRFIPEDMEFDQEPSSVADKMLDGVNYKPASFVTSALNQTKVNLTWEETDPDRLKQTMRKFSKKEVDEMDLKAYLASDSEDEAAEKDEAQKFRSLLGGDADKEEKMKDGDMEMEISWEPGLKEATEKAVKKKTKGGQTPWEKYLEKRAEKKREKLDEKMKLKKKQEVESDDDDVPEGVDINDPFFKDAFSDEELYEKKPGKATKTHKKKGKSIKKTEIDADPDLDLLVMDDDDQKQHFSLEQIMKNEQQKKKKKKRKNDEETNVEDTFKLDLADDRFAAMYSSSAYNIDPSAPDYKKTKAMQAIVDEKLKRRLKESDRPTKKVKTGVTEERTGESIQSLVKSVKAKAKMSNDKKNSKKANKKR